MIANGQVITIQESVYTGDYKISLIFNDYKCKSYKEDLTFFDRANKIYGII